MDKEQDIPEQGPERDWRFVYRHIRERFDKHDTSAIRRSARYKMLAALFHISIPLLSVAITIEIGSKMPYSTQVAFGLGVLLTVLSTLNATLEPARRYREAVDRCIDLHDLRLRMEARIEFAAQQNVSSEQCVDSLLELNLELSEIGRRMAGVPIPMVPRNFDTRQV
jgi:hypothetical protein